MYKCFHCGGNLSWNSDFSFEDYGMEGEGIIHCLSCSDCGADVEYYIRLDKEEDE